MSHLVYQESDSTSESLDTAASTSVNNAISFVMYNEAIFQFVQWFATEPQVELQVLPILIFIFRPDLYSCTAPI